MEFLVSLICLCFSVVASSATLTIEVPKDFCELDNQGPIRAKVFAITTDASISYM